MKQSVYISMICVCRNERKECSNTVLGLYVYIDAQIARPNFIWHAFSGGGGGALLKGGKGYWFCVMAKNT